MIISENKKPAPQVFSSLMARTDEALNQDAAKREDYYCKRSGKSLESDVYEAVRECAKGTPFEGTIQLVSGAAFPDIVAAKCYGIEVKSTEKNHWTSIGSSILESTRIGEVERIYLTFGKLGKPVQFLSRPYEECLSDIAVTHYPRYRIDMKLQKGETIFDKMKVPYDELRRMENPVAPVSRYYRGCLKPGESLWWTGASPEEVAIPPTVRLWRALQDEERIDAIIQGYVLFPEVTGNSQNKYNRYALWLASQRGIVHTNIRDEFSAGGQVELPAIGGIVLRMPAVYGRIVKYKSQIIHMLEEAESTVLQEYWGVTTIEQDRLSQWCRLVASYAPTSLGVETVNSALATIFSKD